ncbi:hypothetical protein FACS18945_5780 [Bacteroidia bacterium]|nr:hypothetical protein FACS189434_11120 [Bacteroidia bacterium]GHT59578.1 hypothetical protein FACS18945_5780 [Bacteroidia bacterium]
MNQQIFDEIRTLKRQILPNEKVILFGSQARGDARPDSDWDLLVLLDKDKSNFNEDYGKYAYPFSEIGYKYSADISAKVYANKEWETRSFTPFYKNVQKDGILIN